MSDSDTPGRLLLSSIIKENRVDEFRRLNYKILVEEKERRIHSLIQDYLSKYSVLPGYSLFVRNKCALPEVDQTFQYYMDLCVSRYGTWLLHDFNNKYGQMIEERKIDDVYLRMQGMINQYKSARPTMDDATLYAMKTDALLDYESCKLRNVTMRGVPFGWPSLDRMTQGMLGGDTIVLAGRPGMGKTYILLRWLLNAQSFGKRCLFVSMEMQKEQLQSRLLGLDAQVNPRSLRSGMVTIFGDNRLHDSVSEEENKTPCHFLFGGLTRDVGSVLAYMETIGPDIVFIDGCYLLTPTERTRSGQERATAVAEEIKKAAIRSNKPFIYTVQFNRQIEVDRSSASAEDETPKKRKRATLSNLYNSDAYGQLGSVVMGIEMAAPPYGKTRRLLSVLKNREGDIGDFEIVYDMAHALIEEAPEENNTGRGVNQELLNSLI